MHGLRVPRTQIGSDHPHVFLEVRFDEDALVIDRSRRREIDVLRHLDDHVRLQAPAFLEHSRRGLVFLIRRAHD